VTVRESRIDISVSVDGEGVEAGHHLLGHRDGTPPEIAARIWSPAESPVEEIRLYDGDDLLPEAEYEVTTDTVEGEPYFHLLFHPQIRNEEYQYRLEALGGEGESAVFVLYASLPITLSIDGREVLDDDFAAGSSRVRAEAVYPGEIPAEEILFELDGAPLPVDSFSLEGEETWKAVASIETGGGSHELLFRAGAFRADRRIRVEDRLRVVDPLAYPNPSGGESGIFYHLTLPADEVRAEIYTVAGRRIRTLRRLSSHIGYNENRLAWDGRDHDGDRVARGVYPFRVIAVRGGEKAEAIGKFVVID